MPEALQCLEEKKMQGIQQRRMKDLTDEIGRNPGEYRIPEAKKV